MLLVKIGGLIAGCFATCSIYYRDFVVPMREAHKAHSSQLTQIEDGLLDTLRQTMLEAPAALRTPEASIS